MQLNTKIKGNDELYGDDIHLIPLNLDAVEQRIEYLTKKAEEHHKAKSDDRDKFIKARDFWKEIKEKHCELETV